MDSSIPDTDKAIITRRFDLADGGHVDIFVWKPEVAGETYLKCEYLIRGLGDENIRDTSGVDDISAIIGVLQIIAIKLYHSQAYKDGKLTWLGTRDLHLPLLPGWTAEKKDYEKAQLLTLVSEISVLSMPGDRFPYMAWPGFKLDELISHLAHLGEADIDRDELRRKIRGVTAWLEIDQTYYEAVCRSEGLDISYIKDDEDTLGQEE